MTDSYRILFNRPGALGRELEYVHEALASGVMSGDGPFGRRCEALLEEWFPGTNVLLTTSCTHALEMSALLVDIEPGDEVVLPSFTFPSVANAFVLRGARPVFVDIREDTLNLDERLLPTPGESKIAAVVPVHYAGVACEMDEVQRWATAAGAVVVEDAAHGPLATYRDRQLGTMGSLAALSFHETKNFSCGEGGALLINDDRYLERARVIREKGTDRFKFFRGMVDKYTWVDLGSSYVVSDVLAAFLLGQLESRDEIMARRKQTRHRYAAGLGAWTASQGVPCRSFRMTAPKCTMFTCSRLTSSSARR